MRVLVFHGYLLRGTGSNVYNAELCAALSRLGHTVDLLCQERHARELPFVDAIGTWHGGEPRVEAIREPVRVTAWRPEIGTLLPVFVRDRYEGLQARTFLECTDEELERYVDANARAVRDVVARAAPDVALANHLIMGPAILARGLGAPYAIKVHGSDLEYAVKRDPDRFLPWVREGLAGARTVLAGSRHTAESLFDAVGDDALPARTRLGPPGVDVAEMRPRADPAAEVRALADRLAAEVGRRGEGAFARDSARAATALRSLHLERDRHVCFVGKLIVSKGIDLLAAAWPLVCGARLVVIGFGGFRDGLERLVDALAGGDREAALDIARAGRQLEGGPRAPLRHLQAFLEAAGNEYWDAARGLRERVVLTGRLEHDELAPLLAACEALVFPSTFPEAFGMVAAEAAACGALPISAGHSGAAEVSAVLGAAVPPAARGWLSFPVDDGAVRAIADRVNAWLQAPQDLRARTREALVATARERYSWEGVAEGVIAAGEGRTEAVTAVRPNG